MDFFDRTWRVVAYAGKANAFFSYTATALEIEDLRVQFAIEKQLGKNPNTCELTITNLNEDSRAFFERDFVNLRIEAGHAGERRLLFAGDVRYAFSVREDTEWQTQIQLADGLRAFRHARVNRSFRPGTTVRTVLAEAALSMGLALPDNIAIDGDLERQFNQGLALVGNTRDELTKLLAPFGYTWSIQDGKLQILKDNGLRPGEAYVISQDAGMLGSPAFGTPSQAKRKKDRRPTLSVQCLLYPQITPGGLIAVRSRNVNGTFRVQRVQHTGDSHGAEWSTDIEAKSV